MVIWHFLYVKRSPQILAFQSSSKLFELGWNLRVVELQGVVILSATISSFFQKVTIFIQGAIMLGFFLKQFVFYFPPSPCLPSWYVLFACPYFCWLFQILTHRPQSPQDGMNERSHSLGILGPQGRTTCFCLRSYRSGCCVKALSGQKNIY